ncbi:MAG: NAD-dependent deacylase [Flavobacteriales bacterium]|nr:NAD-dependent deacylase [Flavobacteriales bacterium]
MRPRERIVVFTGAGVSAESGLRTFRDGDGLWEEHRLENVATPGAWQRDPELVLRFYDERRAHVRRAVPNAAHLAIASLQDHFEVDVVTQNIDDLHERGGSANLIHMHGELLKARCLDTGEAIDWREDITLQTPSPVTGNPGRLRPHVVWFGEMPLHMERVTASLQSCALFLAIGTSGLVYPAAGFVALVRDRGRAHTIELNLEPSAVRSDFAEARHGPAGTTVPALVDELLAL